MLAAAEVVTAPVPEFSSPALIPYPSRVTKGTGKVRFKSVRAEMGKDVPRREEHIRGKGKEVIVWSPGGPHDGDSVLMCWRENEAGTRMDKGMKRIDTNGFYIDWADSQSGVYQVFFQ